jgi:hypothetical protein
MNPIQIKAGRKAYRLIKDGGFHFDQVAAYYGPAAGPRWLAASGFDLALLQKGVLGRSRSVSLIGASAGAWRFAAWIQPEPEKSYRTLMEKYITTIYTRSDTAATVLKSLSAIMDDYLEDDALPFALANKKYRLAVLTVRSKNLVASELKIIQALGLGLSFLLNALNRRAMHRFFEPVVFYQGAKPPPFCLAAAFRGKFVPLTEVNFKYAVLSSGAIPLVVGGVKDIFGAPKGVYRDGGMLDYHLNQNYAAKDDDITLFFLHQERIIPGWMDKKLKRRRPPDDVLDNVLMVHLSDEFVEKLPYGKVPDRSDFKTFIDDPVTRIKYWRQAVEQAAPLGEQFLELVAGGRIRDVVEPLWHDQDEPRRG